jgi:hypothetical protein
MAKPIMRMVQAAALFLCVFVNIVAADSTVTVKSNAPAQKFFEIVAGPAKVLKYLKPQSPLLGLASSQETFPIVGTGTSWCRILYTGDTGWVERGAGKIVDSPTVISAKIPNILVIILIGVSVTLVLILGVIFVVLSLKRQKFKRYAPRRDVLIISPVDKEIRYSLTDASTTVSKCFTEIGFKVSSARDIDHARNLLIHYAPDVLVVDWQMERNILSKIGSILSGKESASSIIVVFYNVPDPSEMTRRNQSPSVHFVGPVFSDRDIFKIVTPLIMAGQATHTFKKSVQSSALEGEIGSGNLVEVMQFIEIGRKTGCLYITLKTPVAIIYFEQGRITYATSPTTQGRNAIDEILSMQEGHFQFVLDKVSPIKNLNCSTLEVLMEWTRRNDEAHRN